MAVMGGAPGNSPRWRHWPGRSRTIAGHSCDGARRAVRARPFADVAPGGAGVEVHDDGLEPIGHGVAEAGEVEVLPDGIPAAGRLRGEVEEALSRDYGDAGQFDRAGRYLGRGYDLVVGRRGDPAAVDEDMHFRAGEAQRGDHVITGLFPVQPVVDQDLVRGIVGSPQHDAAMAQGIHVDRYGWHGHGEIAAAAVEFGLHRGLRLGLAPLPQAERDEKPAAGRPATVGLHQPCLSPADPCRAGVRARILAHGKLVWRLVDDQGARVVADVSHSGQPVFGAVLLNRDGGRRTDGTRADRPHRSIDFAVRAC